jgi:hypothetical protein
MFMKRHGLDRRLRLTKMFEYLYYRYLLNLIALVIAIGAIVGRLLAIYEVSWIPFSGSQEATEETYIIMVVGVFMFFSSIHAIKDFKSKVIDRIPNFAKEMEKEKSTNAKKSSGDKKSSKS